MLKIGDHVYDKEVQANGIVKEIKQYPTNCPSPDDIRQKYRIEFFWAHYCYVANGSFPHKGYGKGIHKWQWCYEDSLIKVNFPINPKHRVALVNKRITDKRLREVCLISYASEGPADIHIRYGGNYNRYSTKLCINENIVFDKAQQMEMLGNDLINESHSVLPYNANPNEWIIKPLRSCGGKNIRPYDGRLRMNDYVQKKFNKVREFRAHTFLWNDNPVPLIQEKVIADPNQLCWNKKQGGAFQYVYQNGLDYGKYINNLSLQNVNVMRSMSVQALKRLRVDYGGIDFGMDAIGNFKIFEVNSAMGLRERSLFTYKEVFCGLGNLNIDNYKQERWI